MVAFNGKYRRNNQPHLVQILVAAYLTSFFTNNSHAGCWLQQVTALSNQPNNEGRTEASSNSRRAFVKVPIAIGGAVIYGNLLSDAVKKLTRGELAYPDDHERRVESSIALALENCIPSASIVEGGGGIGRPLRVLEVGVGQDLRIIRRNLYNQSLEALSRKGVSSMTLTGVDIKSPNDDVMNAAKARLDKNNGGVDVDINVVQGSIESLRAFSDGYFDSIICCLTLCSVNDPTAAVKEMKRLLRPDGGTFAYVEHEAVNDDEPYKLLQWQQIAFDPLQQVAAENCHLRRFTDSTIADVFAPGSGTASWLSKERFLVKDMWPVSCQSCGVLQLIS